MKREKTGYSFLKEHRIGWLYTVLVALILLSSVQLANAEPFEYIKFDGTLPPNALELGLDENGTTKLYGCRASYGGGVHPGKFLADHCNIGWGGNEIVLDDFEVLVKESDKGWYYEKNPKDLNSVFVGGQELGRTLPVCIAPYWTGGIFGLFASYHGSHPGKLIAHKCNIGFGGKEVEIQDFFVIKIGDIPTCPSGIIGLRTPAPTCIGLDSTCDCEKSSTCCHTAHCECKSGFAVCN